MSFIRYTDRQTNSDGVGEIAYSVIKVFIFEHLEESCESSVELNKHVVGFVGIGAVVVANRVGLIVIEKHELVASLQPFHCLIEFGLQRCVAIVVEPVGGAHVLSGNLWPEQSSAEHMNLF